VVRVGRAATCGDVEKTLDKKMGCSTSTPKVKAEKLPLLRGLFLSALGCLLRHFFLLRLL
jgi:hypothetical protein